MSRGRYPFPEPVSVLHPTVDWPEYERRYRELFGDVEQYCVVEGEYPEDPAYVVVPGSTHSLVERSRPDWAAELVARTREYVRSGVPVLGVCFGHQAIAAALGADIVRMDDYEIGYEPVRLGDSPLFAGLSDREYPFSTHRDAVGNLPEELRPVATSDRCVQAVAHVERPVFGVQFHLDLTPPIVKRAIREKDLPDSRERRLLASVTPDNVARADRTLRIFENFRALATG